MIEKNKPPVETPTKHLDAQVQPTKRADGTRAAVLQSFGEGLYLQAKPTADGGVSHGWFFVYWTGGRKAQKKHKLALGGYAYSPRPGKLTLAQARFEARKCWNTLHLDHKDPLIERRMQQEATQRTRDAQDAAAFTFNMAAAAYIETQKTGWTEKEATRWPRLFALHVPFGDAPINDISREDIIAVIRPLWSTQRVIARRLRSNMFRVFAWAIRNRKRTDGVNPCQWVGDLQDEFSRSKYRPRHHRSLAYKDLPAFMAKVRASKSIAAPALAFTVLTCARTDMTRLLPWSEIDLKTRVWAVPADRMKMTRAHNIPLSDAATAILEAIKGDRAKPEGYVFLSPRGQPIGENAMLALTKILAKDDDMTVHGFRTSIKNWATNCTDVRRELIEEALAHLVGSKTEQAYRHDDDPQHPDEDPGLDPEPRRPLMELWASYCTAGVVIPMKRRA
jgi:integrase